MTKYDNRLGSILRVYRARGWVPGLLVSGVLLLGGCGPARLIASSGVGAGGSVPASAVAGYLAPPDTQIAVDAQTGETLNSSGAAWTLDRDAGPGRWTVRSYETDLETGAEATRAVSGHVIGPYGTVYLAWSRSVKDTDPDGPPRLFVFDPPLIWFPGSIEPGLVFEHRTRLTERDPSDESRVALSGKATRRVAIVDETSAGWPFGERVGRAIAAELRIRVGPAEAVRRRTILLDADGHGGDEFVDYAIRVLGVPLKRERTLYVTDR